MKLYSPFRLVEFVLDEMDSEMPSRCHTDGQVYLRGIRFPLHFVEFSSTK